MAAETATDAGTGTENYPPLQLFYVYEQQDEALRKELNNHLSLLQRQGLIALWHERLIEAGSVRQHEIDSHLEHADIILLLISASFLASDDCYNGQMQRALERHEAGTARVIPILLRPCDWESSPFGILRALPTNAKPVIEWPNHDSAFADITRGLRQVIDDLTGNSNVPQPRSSSQHSRPIWNIPFERNALFTGREDILQRLQEALSRDRTAALTQPPQAISGLGGIGKTQTAIEYAYRHCAEYRYVFWARAETQQELASDYTTIAALLNLPERRLANQDQKVAVVKRWLQDNASWLLILDNADDLSLVQPFLPIGSRGHIILTTRTQVLGHVAQRIEIERMEPDEGSLFLLRRASILAEDAPLDKISPTTRARAQEIVKEVDGLPLALEQAGAYIEETSCGLDGYLQAYRTQRADLLNHRGSTPNPDYRETVATTWTLAFQKVEAANPAAADLLRLCAFLSPDAIPEEIITTGASDLGPNLKSLSNPTKLNTAIAELLKYSLIKRDPDTHILSLHRLVQAVLLDPMSKRTQRTWAERATRAVNRAFPKKVEFTNWSQCQRLLPSAQSCATLIGQDHLAFREAANLLNRVARYLRAQGQYTQALPFYQQTLNVSEQISGSDHTDTATSLNNLAYLYFKQGQYAEAEPLYKRALAIYELLSGLDHPNTAAPLNNLGLLYQAQGRYEQAEQSYKHALSIKERALGLEHPETATTLDNLAELYRVQRQYAEAEPFYQRSLAIKEKMLGLDHPNTATTLNNLGLLYQDQGRYEKAEQSCQRALNIKERVLGPEHPDTAIPLLSMAVLYQKRGRYEEAEALYRRVLAIDEKVFGSEHPDVVNCLQWYASLLRETGRAEEAKGLEERIRAIREKREGM